jgi:hypothetical protein
MLSAPGACPLSPPLPMTSDDMGVNGTGKRRPEIDIADAGTSTPAHP